MATETVALWPTHRSSAVTPVTPRYTHWSSAVSRRECRGGRPQALTHASFNGHGDVVRILLEHGANPNVLTSIDGATGADDFSPLHRACLHGHLGAVKALLEFSADVAMQKADGYHALLFACLHGHIDVARGECRSARVLVCGAEETVPVCGSDAAPRRRAGEVRCGPDDVAILGAAR